MTPVEVLKKGLTKLHDQIRERKAKLEVKLKASQPISEVDEDWLDGDGNLIDEERVVETLDSASDYEQGLARLDSQDKTVVQKLQKLAESGSRKNDAPSKKQKRKASKFPCLTASDTPTPAGEKPLNPLAESQKKENATLKQRIEILDWHNANGRVQKKTASHFHAIYPSLKIKQPLVSAWVKNEARWRAEYESSGASARSAKKVCQTQHPEVAEMLDLWVSKAMADKLLLTGEVLRQKWKTFADLTGVPDDKRINLSDGWLSCFKVRNNLKNMKRHGEAASAPPDTVEKERLCLQELIKKEGYKPHNIFNADESSLFYA
ncbi:hypothetical protein PAXRUDRAFT_168237 [Paxillus rubicundulus Ve08.2h10]|uniref:HTH CENPB-type domain-containing protein n=1 Tax=Paxillus rubicundulus Ve08.2h10 TaxID=930991 RepID=A0A0D0CNZ6_9AGAM|nr:hypothetical protein PAXRUDRAFT_168237 [Paxillus rubicundulus Ve08.2h10]